MVYQGGILYENAPYPNPSVSLQATNANQNQHGTLTKLSRTTNPQACSFYTPVPSSPPQFNICTLPPSSPRGVRYRYRSPCSQPTSPSKYVLSSFPRDSWYLIVTPRSYLWSILPICTKAVFNPLLAQSSTKNRCLKAIKAATLPEPLSRTVRFSASN
ncbi:hypothetical protein NM208_g11229 [Fusarium decemcellulare]|uniref:Uncharacterized protein n=1 Tax=Fusarium decemcellulare TaxID=57161 RepID=A0ACC1RV36_9HYPO|nr:hypothetical protein NM208_g11229 [Fusarium decemcellulare]